MKHPSDDRQNSKSKKTYVFFSFPEFTKFSIKREEFERMIKELGDSLGTSIPDKDLRKLTKLEDVVRYFEKHKSGYPYVDELAKFIENYQHTAKVANIADDKKVNAVKTGNVGKHVDHSKIRKFNDIKTYMALCQIGNDVAKARVNLDEGIVRAIAQEFESKIKEQACLCIPEQASEWCNVLFLEPFVKHVNCEEILRNFTNSIKKSIKSSRESYVNERIAKDWIGFIENIEKWINNIDYIYKNLIPGYIDDINGEEMSPGVAEGMCKLLRKFNDGLREAKIFDVLKELQLSKGRSIWDIDTFRKAAWTCLTKKAGHDDLIRTCMAEIFEEIKREPKLFKTWGNVFISLKNEGVKLDSSLRSECQIDMVNLV